MMRSLRYGAVLAAFLASSAQPARAAGDDEFAWLEPPQEARAVAWARAQTALATGALESLPVSAELKAEFERTMRSAAPVPGEQN